MKIYNVIILAASAGFLIAHLLHRHLEWQRKRQRKAVERRAELLAEYHDKQLWQFVSIEEWIAANARGLR